MTEAWPDEAAYKGGLTRELILRTALRIADAEGVPALSFRRVATELGVTPMALYGYVESKEDLLRGTGDLALGMLELPNRADDWHDRFRNGARNLRRLLVAHPAAIFVFTGTVPDGPLTPNGCRAQEAALGILRDGGFEPAEAAAVLRLTMLFVVAMARAELERPRLPDQDSMALMQSALRQIRRLPKDEFPNLIEAAPFLCEPPDPDQSFEQGLDLILAGLDALGDTWASDPPEGR